MGIQNIAESVGGVKKDNGRLEDLYKMKTLYNKLQDDWGMIKNLFTVKELFNKNFIIFLVLVLLLPYFMSVIFTILCNGNECLKI